MRSNFVTAREFVRGAASRLDRIFIISKGKALLTQGIAHTSLIAVAGEGWADGINTSWDSTAIAIARRPSAKLIVVGEDGDVAVYLGNSKSLKEKISPDPVLIRNARGISGYVYACGMKRQVYERVDEGKWVDLSAPFPEANVTAGFEAIDGYSESEIYAVGWSGEIWEYNGSKWADRTGPTNVILSAVHCAPNNMVYIAGQQGVLIRGRNSSWEIVEWEGEVSDDLWDLCWFQDKLYVSTMMNLYTLDGNKLVEVDFGETEVNTFYNLTSAEGVLWSIGKDDVASFDGKTWQTYE